MVNRAIKPQVHGAVGRTVDPWAKSLSTLNLCKMKIKERRRAKLFPNCFPNIYANRVSNEFSKLLTSHLVPLSAGLSISIKALLQEL